MSKRAWWTIAIIAFCIGAVVISETIEDQPVRQPAARAAAPAPKPPPAAAKAPAKPKPKPAPKPAPIPRYSAVQISARYENNAIEADRALKGKQIIVTGKVGSIDKGILGRPYLVLEGGVHDVHCSFDKFSERPLAALNRGQTVSVQGTCRGMVLFDPSLCDCQLLAGPPPGSVK